MEWARYNTELININLIVKLSNKKGALHFPPSRTPNSSFRVRDLTNGPNTAGTKRAEQPHGLSCVALFERSAGVFADRAAS